MSFILWFAVYGRHHYKEIANIDRFYVALLNIATASGHSILADYVLSEAKTRSEDPATGSDDEIIARAIHDLRLGPLVIPPPGQGQASRPIKNAVSIVGFHRHTLGLGEDARTMFDMARSLDMAVSLTDIGNPTLASIREVERFHRYECDRPIFPVSIICAPLFETARIFMEWGKGWSQDRYVIGLWPWELTDFPPYWHHVFEAVSEVWAPSRFLQGIYARLTDKPVVHMPLHVAVDAPDLDVMTRYGPQDNAFTFLSFLDFNSSLKRKNAVGSVRAFKAAFKPDDRSVRLLIKTTHADEASEAWKELLEALGPDDRIHIVDGAMSRAEVCGLIQQSDVFLSLHRAEGFGRVIGEAMLLGTTVVATDWSGSRDLLNAQTGYPVRYSLIDVGPDDYPEAAGRWAEPDLDDAAQVMRQVRDNPFVREARACAAREHVSRHFSLTAVAKIVGARLAEIERLGLR